MSSIADLIASRRPGHALPQAFYVDEAIYRRDLDLLLGRWTCVGHVSSLPDAGDWFTAELGAESAIVARGEDGRVRALANVCRHRGSRLCHGRGHGAMLTCPYHAWTYRLDGTLRSARQMPESFRPQDHGLVSLPLRIVGGLILVCFGDDTPSLAHAEPALAAFTDHYGWATARVAWQATWPVSANWKLAMENYHECYHCGPSHPEFAALHALARPGNRRLRGPGEREDAAFDDVERWAAAAVGEELVRVMTSELTAGQATGSAGGAPVAPVMARAGYDGTCAFAEVGYLSAFLAYPDHGLIYRFIPKGVADTDMEVIWLVRGDAREGVDYDLKRLTWLWDVTTAADKAIIEDNQAGVASRAYAPGPYSLMEPGTAQYADRYLADLAALEARR